MNKKVFIIMDALTKEVVDVSLTEKGAVAKVEKYQQKVTDDGQLRIAFTHVYTIKELLK